MPTKDHHSHRQLKFAVDSASIYHKRDEKADSKKAEGKEQLPRPDTNCIFTLEASTWSSRGQFLTISMPVQI